MYFCQWCVINDTTTLADITTISSFRCSCCCTFVSFLPCPPHFEFHFSSMHTNALHYPTHHHVSAAGEPASLCYTFKTPSIRVALTVRTTTTTPHLSPPLRSFLPAFSQSRIQNPATDRQNDVLKIQQQTEKMTYSKSSNYSPGLPLRMAAAMRAMTSLSLSSSGIMRRWVRIYVCVCVV